MPDLKRGPFAGLKRSGLGGAVKDEVSAPGSVELSDVEAGYGRHLVFAGFNLDVAPGEFVYLVGPSGSGKSTLLRVLFGAVRPRAGTVLVDGVAVHDLHRWQTRAIRRRLGCVFQSYELLPHLTALENVLMPLRLAHPELRDPRGYAEDALELVGLGDKMRALPGNLSGGQQQRVAIARALAHQPRVLLADEPTGNVDNVMSAEIVELFNELNRLGSTVVMATHDEFIQSRFPRRAVHLAERRLRVAS